MRHKEAGRSAEVESPGGKRQESRGKVVQQQSGQELGREDGVSQAGILGGHFSEFEQAFEAFEGDFDLPTEPIQVEDLSRWERRALERSQQDHVGSRLERTGIGETAVFRRLSAEFTASLLGRRFALAHGHEPCREGGELTAGVGFDLQVTVAGLALGKTAQKLKQVKGGLVAVLHGNVGPGHADDKVGLRIDDPQQPAGWA